MQEHWLRLFKGTPGMRVLKVEYETLSWKKAEMMRIIERNKSRELPVRRERSSVYGNGLEGYLSAERTELKEWTWKGTSRLDGKEWSHHGTDDKVEYVVVTDTWRFVEGQLSDKEMSGRRHVRWNGRGMMIMPERYPAVPIRAPRRPEVLH
jgi:hypothetical protein